MEFIQVLGLVIAALIAALLLLWVVSSLYSRQRRRLFSDEDASSKKALEICLKDVTYKRNVISNLYFPVKKDGAVSSESYLRIEQIVVGSGGVIVFAVCRYEGKIDNRADDIWISIRDDERFEFRSPSVQLSEGAELIRDIMRRKGFKEPLVYEAVVFNDTRSQPVEYGDGVVFLSEIEKLIRDLNESKTYDMLDQYFIIRAIRGAGISKQKLKQNFNK